MKNKLLNSLSEKYGARSAGEKKFIDINKVDKKEDRNGNKSHPFVAVTKKDRSQSAAKQRSVDPSANDVEKKPSNDVHNEYGMNTSLGEDVITESTRHADVHDELTNKGYKHVSTDKTDPYQHKSIYVKHMPTTGEFAFAKVTHEPAGLDHMDGRVSSIKHKKHVFSKLIESVEGSTKEDIEVAFADGSTAIIDNCTAEAIANINSELSEENQQKFQSMLFESQESFDKAKLFVEANHDFGKYSKQADALAKRHHKAADKWMKPQKSVMDPKKTMGPDKEVSSMHRKDAKAFERIAKHLKKGTIGQARRLYRNLDTAPRDTAPKKLHDYLG